MIKKEIGKLIQKAVDAPEEKIQVSRTEEESFGDYTTNIALKLKKSPAEIAGRLKSDIFGKVEVAGPGFINFFLSDRYLQKKLGQILKEKEKFGQSKPKKKQKINIEFISANPTGPLTLGNGRGGFYGDVLANIMAAAGHKAEREYYINNVGEQIKKLGHSVIGDSEAVYRGEYIEKLRERIKEKDPEKTGQKAADIILKEMIRPAAAKMKIDFDVWFSERTLDEKIDEVLKFLEKKGLAKKIKDKEDTPVLWFKSEQFGDDKDRVLIKPNGEKTYLASDAAYLKNKFERGFDKLIYIWGADHHGYIGRIKAMAEALGYDKKRIDIIIMQLVRLFDEGREVRMSKRTGIYVSIEELIGEVGLDAARFFFLSRSADGHLNFDLDLAKEQSSKNPVYYVQYAHARICSILKKSGKAKPGSDFELLNHPSETNLIKELVKLPEIVEEISCDYQVQSLPRYAVELATAFHKFYKDCKVISEDKKLTQARLSLVLATKIVLKNTLSLMGISAPEKM